MPSGSWSTHNVGKWDKLINTSSWPSLYTKVWYPREHDHRILITLLNHPTIISDNKMHEAMALIALLSPNQLNPLAKEENIHVVHLSPWTNVVAGASSNLLGALVPSTLTSLYDPDSVTTHVLGLFLAWTIYLFSIPSSLSGYTHFKTLFLLHSPLWSNYLCAFLTCQSCTFSCSTTHHIPL